MKTPITNERQKAANLRRAKKRIRDRMLYDLLVAKELGYFK